MARRFEFLFFFFLQPGGKRPCFLLLFSSLQSGGCARQIKCNNGRHTHKKTGSHKIKQAIFPPPHRVACRRKAPFLSRFVWEERDCYFYFKFSPVIFLLAVWFRLLTHTRSCTHSQADETPTLARARAPPKRFFANSKWQETKLRKRYPRNEGKTTNSRVQTTKRKK